MALLQDHSWIRREWRGRIGVGRRRGRFVRVGGVLHAPAGAFLAAAAGAGGLANESMVSGLFRRELTRDDLPPVSAIDAKVRAVHGPNFAARLQLGHPQQAGIRKLHLPVAILVQEAKHGPGLGGKIEVQPEVAVDEQLQAGNRRAQEEGQFVQNRFAGVEGSMGAQLGGGPCVSDIVPVKGGLQQASVSDSFHVAVGARGGARWRCRRS